MDAPLVDLDEVETMLEQGGEVYSGDGMVAPPVDLDEVETMLEQGEEVYSGDGMDAPVDYLDEVETMLEQGEEEVYSGDAHNILLVSEKEGTGACTRGAVRAWCTPGTNEYISVMGTIKTFSAFNIETVGEQRINKLEISKGGVHVFIDRPTLYSVIHGTNRAAPAPRQVVSDEGSEVESYEIRLHGHVDFADKVVLKDIFKLNDTAFPVGSVGAGDHDSATIIMSIIVPKEFIELYATDLDF